MPALVICYNFVISKSRWQMYYVATIAINPVSIFIYFLNLLCIIHLLKVFKGHLFIYINDALQSHRKYK